MPGLLLVLMMVAGAKRARAAAAICVPPNPPAPTGTKPWRYPLTPELTAWAQSIVNDPTSYPMFATVARVFNGRCTLARVECHAWTIRDGKRVPGRFRGVTLYELAAVSAAAERRWAAAA